MPPAPVAEPVDPTVGIVADLNLEVGDGAHRTRAHLTGGPGALVLDVDDPSVLLRSVPRHGRWHRLPEPGMTDLLSGITIQVRSQDSDLGSVRFPPGRRPALRPTGAGLGYAARLVSRRPAVRSVVGLIVAALVAVRVRSVRHQKERPPR